MAEHEPRVEDKEIWDFVDEILVECAACRDSAVVVSESATGCRRLTCGQCGATKDQAARRTSIVFRPPPSADVSGCIVIGSPVDPYFHLPLWLQVPCGREVLWAYNRRHLEFLQAFVGSKLRQRPASSEAEADGPRNRLLASRLPTWMKLAKNRARVLAGLERLSEKL